MHIKSYQISNILNTYRRQLSLRTSRPDQPAVKTPMITNQYKSILDKVSLDLMAHVTDSGTEKRFETTLGPAPPVAPNDSQAEAREKLCFAYTLIDENNNKSTNSLTVDEFYPFAHRNITYETLAPKTAS